MAAGSCERSLGILQPPMRARALGPSACHLLLATGVTCMVISFPWCWDGGLQPRGVIFTTPWSCRQPSPDAGQRDEASNQSYPSRRLSKWILLTGSCLPEGRKNTFKRLISGLSGMFCLDIHFHPLRWSGAAARGLGPRGASSPQLTEPLDGCICWQREKNNKTKKGKKPAVFCSAGGRGSGW